MFIGEYQEEHKSVGSDFMLSWKNLASGSWLCVVFSNVCNFFIPSYLLMLFALTSAFLQDIAPNLNMEAFVV